jgi:hypothetical protein
MTHIVAGLYYAYLGARVLLGASGGLTGAFE